MQKIASFGSSFGNSNGTNGNANGNGNGSGNGNGNGDGVKDELVIYFPFTLASIAHTVLGKVGSCCRYTIWEAI